MPKRKKKVPITSDVKRILDTWAIFAKANHIELATWNPLAMRAQQVIDGGGACPCKTEERPSCPCKECLDEVREEGACFCQVFCNLKRFKEIRGLK